MNSFEQPPINSAENEHRNLKEQVVASAKSKLESFKKNKPEIVRAFERNFNLPAESSEEEMLDASNEMTSLEGWDADEKALQLLKEGITLEDLGTSREELIQLFADQGNVGIDNNSFEIELDEILGAQKKNDSESV